MSLRASLFAFALVAAPAGLTGGAGGMEHTLRKKLHGSWEEVKVVAPGVHLSQGRAQIWWHIDERGATEYYNTGQLETTYYAVYLDFRSNPIRMDLAYHDSDRHRVMLGIIKFEDDRLIWVTRDYVDFAVWKQAKGDPPGRPKDFTATKENKCILRVLERFPARAMR